MVRVHLDRLPRWWATSIALAPIYNRHHSSRHVISTKSVSSDNRQCGPLSREGSVIITRTADVQSSDFIRIPVITEPLKPTHICTNSTRSERWYDNPIYWGTSLKDYFTRRTQDLPIFVRMIDKDTYWTFENGLPTLITTLLQVKNLKAWIALSNKDARYSYRYLLVPLVVAWIVGKKWSKPIWTPHRQRRSKNLTPVSLYVCL